MLMTHDWLRVSRLSVGGPEQNNDSWVFSFPLAINLFPLLFGKVILCRIKRHSNHHKSPLAITGQCKGCFLLQMKADHFKCQSGKKECSTRLSQVGEAKTSQRWISVNFLCFRTLDVTRMSNDGISQTCSSKDKTSLFSIKKSVDLFKNLGSARLLLYFNKINTLI